MSRFTDMRGDELESSGWLFKSPLAGGGGIMWRPYYRPHSLLLCPRPVRAEALSDAFV